MTASRLTSLTAAAIILGLALGLALTTTTTTRPADALKMGVFYGYTSAGCGNGNRVTTTMAPDGACNTLSPVLGFRFDCAAKTMSLFQNATCAPEKLMPGMPVALYDTCAAAASAQNVQSLAGCEDVPDDTLLRMDVFTDASYVGPTGPGVNATECDRASPLPTNLGAPTMTLHFQANKCNPGLGSFGSAITTSSRITLNDANTTLNVTFYTSSAECTGATSSSASYGLSFNGGLSACYRQGSEVRIVTRLRYPSAGNGTAPSRAPSSGVSVSVSSLSLMVNALLVVAVAGSAAWFV